MYCVNCGERIPEGSNYCGKCGTKISSTNHIIIKNYYAFFIKYKEVICIYVIWSCIHLMLYILADNATSLRPSYYFFPFSNSFNGFGDISYYDSTELLVYVVIIPIMILAFYVLYNSPWIQRIIGQFIKKHKV